jgi:hypothetical protein
MIKRGEPQNSGHSLPPQSRNPLLKLNIPSPRAIASALEGVQAYPSVTLE